MLLQISCPITIARQLAGLFWQNKIFYLNYTRKKINTHLYLKKHFITFVENVSLVSHYSLIIIFVGYLLFIVVPYNFIVLNVKKKWVFLNISLSIIQLNTLFPIYFELVGRYL